MIHGCLSTEVTNDQISVGVVLALVASDGRGMAQSAREVCSNPRCRLVAAHQPLLGLLEGASSFCYYRSCVPVVRTVVVEPTAERIHQIVAGNSRFSTGENKKLEIKNATHTRAKRVTVQRSQSLRVIGIDCALAAVLQRHMSPNNTAHAPITANGKV
jgi:hypothetical protein